MSRFKSVGLAVQVLFTLYNDMVFDLHKLSAEYKTRERRLRPTYILRSRIPFPCLHNRCWESWQESLHSRQTGIEFRRYNEC